MNERRRRARRREPDPIAPCLSSDRRTPCANAECPLACACPTTSRRGSGSKRLLLPPNSRINFAQQPDGTYTAQDDPRFFGTVLRLASSSPREWELQFKDGRKWRFGMTDATGLTASFLIETLDAQGNATQITRRADRRITAIGTPQRAYTLSYGANGFVQEIRDPANRTMRMTYTPTNRIETITNPEGGVTRYTYVGDDEFANEPLCPQGTDGQRIKTILYRGRPNPTQNFHGPSRRVLRQSAFDGTETKFAYQLAGACVTHVNSPGTRCTGPNCPTLDSWDNYQAGWRIRGGQVVATTVTRADGSSSTKRYTAKGLTAERIDASGQSSTDQRDADNRVTLRRDALGRTTRFTYDTQGNVTRSVDTLNRITDITYDPRWNKPTSITRYAEDGSPITQLLSYSATTGNLIRSTNPLNQSTEFSYTPQGQLSSVTDALGNASVLSYNAAGDLTAAIDPLGNDSRLDYDAIGRATQSTDPLGYSAATQYNALDQPTQSTDPLGGVTRFAYDPANRLTSVTNALNKVVESYAYDSGDRLIQRTDALNRSETLTYDALGRVATSTDRKGQLSTYSYDAQSRLTRLQRADGTLGIAYDAIGRVQRIEDSAGNSTLSFEYDNADRLVKETQTTSAGNHSIVYEYDQLDRRVRRTVNGGEPTTYSWDKTSRLTSIGYAGQSTSYAYDAAGRLTVKTLPNGITQTHAYDNASRLTAITYAQPDASVIETIAYTYDANGRRTSKSSASNSTAQETGFTATYDDADRMTAVTLKGTGAGGADQACTLAYDNNGNLATKTCGASVTSYTWDAQDRLMNISGPGVTASFGYDALGRRTTRTVNGTTTTYVYDGAQAIGETRGGIDTVLLTGLQIDEVIGRYSGSGNRLMLTDALGSVIAEARDDRSIATRREYTPFGQGTATGEASANDSQYTARENDGTGLYFYRARYFDAQLKRFVSQDPVGLGGGINQSAFVDGDPVSMVDPFGLFGWADMPDLSKAANFSAGFGDALTSGFGLFDTSLTELAREQFGSNDSVDKCSDAYRYGGYGADAWAMAFGTAAVARGLGWTVSFDKYRKAGGGGINVLKDGARRFGLDWHRFKLNGTMVNRPHYHSGATKSQMKKHRPWQ
jgi:RHS repeat-associated protein